jgi:hypothetical protein
VDRGEHGELLIEQRWAEQIGRGVGRIQREVGEERLSGRCSPLAGTAGSQIPEMFLALRG